jgi:phosphatidylserine/phosphatidylglycerophosphate/cardiolipin synthase-like enzyme
MLTPNVTAPTVLSLLRHALSRGVNITIWTNQTLMTAEQLVTAGSTTPRCLTTLIRESAKMPGQLAVRYFDAPSSPGGQGATDVEAGRKPRESTPIKLHAKVTIVDEDKMLLGSGNMDAASWGTSQELGVLLESKAIVEAFKEEWPFAGLNR